MARRAAWPGYGPAPARTESANTRPRVRGRGQTLDNHGAGREDHQNRRLCTEEPLRGQPDRPDRRRVPHGREPPDAHARGRAAAVQEAGGRGSQLRHRALPPDARRREDRAAVPQAPQAVAQGGRAAGLGRGRAVRHRAPRAAQRAAQARPGPRAAGPVLAAARHPAGPRASALGGPRHRGPARRPGGDVHQDPPRPRRRRLGDAAAAERAVHRPRAARHARPVGGPAAQARPHQGRGARARRRAGRRAQVGARHHRRGGRPARRAGQDAAPQPQERDVGALALRPADDPQPDHHRLPPVRRPGLADRADEGDRQVHRHHHQRRGAGDVQRRDADLPHSSSTRCPTPPWSRWSRSG